MSATIPLGRVEQELTKRLSEMPSAGQSPVLRARMANLVIYCDRPEEAGALTEAAAAVLLRHPARVLLLVVDPQAPPGVSAAVNSWSQPSSSSQRHIYCEQITLSATPDARDRLAYAVRALLICDLPTNLWWAALTPPALAGPFLYELAEYCQQILYDSSGWTEPARGVAATAPWLARCERLGDNGGRWRVASDLGWRRLKYWRRTLAQALDPKSAPGAAQSISEILVEHGPHAVVQAWMLVSWAAARLGWRVQAARVQPNKEISWKATAPHGPLQIRLHRLAEGPAEVRRVRLACTLEGKPGALNIAVEGERRLAVTPEGVPGMARTITIQPQPLVDLVARQLSDREHDDVFVESMKVAQVLAQSVLGTA
jgi:glucose-6-phosphate dehydrogenase assembly protein OpcA